MIQLAVASESSLGDDLIVALFSAVIAVVLLGLVGYRLAYYWDNQRRLRESDLAAVETFYRLYGEFFATWKRWDSHKRHGVNADAHRDIQ